MTIIVWDGKTLAADRLAETNGCCFSATKIFKTDKSALGVTGDLALGLQLIARYSKGAVKEDFPKFENDRWCRLIVADANYCEYYGQSPHPIQVEDCFAAWGTGRDFAYGALEMGASAKEAVEVASKHCITCGLGVDVIYLCEFADIPF